jgi:hypothetical protein
MEIKRKHRVGRWSLAQGFVFPTHSPPSLYVRYTLAYQVYLARLELAGTYSKKGKQEILLHVASSSIQE